MHATTAAWSCTAASSSRCSRCRRASTIILAALEAAGHERDAAARLPGVAPAARARRRVRRVPARRARALAGGGPARATCCRAASRRAACGATASRRASAARMGYYAFDASTPIVEGTWDAALAAAHCALTAAAIVVEGEAAAYALCRPPGHHAGRSTYRRLLLPQQCGARRAVPARRGLPSRQRARHRLPPRQRHAGDLLGARRRAVRVAARHAGHRVPVLPRLRRRARRGPRRGLHAQPAAAARAPAGTPTQDALDVALDAIGRYAPDALVVSLGVDTFEGDPISAFKLDGRALSADRQRCWPASVCRRCSCRKAATRWRRSAPTSRASSARSRAGRLRLGPCPSATTTAISCSSNSRPSAASRRAPCSAASASTSTACSSRSSTTTSSTSRRTTQRRKRYEAAGSRPFCPDPSRPEQAMGYWQVPGEVLEDPDELAAWARESAGVALAKRSKRVARRRAPAARRGARR